MDLLCEWRQWNSGSPPYMLEADAPFLKRSGEYYDDIRRVDYDSKDKRLHLGLLPGPFMGDILNASIYILTLNPGYRPRDYDGDKKPDFRRAMLANLKQERMEGVLPFTLLDPQFAWHDGFQYWRSRSKKVIQELAKERGTSREKARSELGEKLAVIQLVPYHSASFDEIWLRRCLPSVRLAQEFVRDTVVERVRAKQSIAIVIRQVKYWDQYLEGLTEEQGVKRYRGGECRAASLTSAKDLILRHLRVAR